MHILLTSLVHENGAAAVLLIETVRIFNAFAIWKISGITCLPEKKLKCSQKQFKCFICCKKFLTFSVL